MIRHIPFSALKMQAGASKVTPHKVKRDIFIGEAILQYFQRLVWNWNSLNIIQFLWLFHSNLVLCKLYHCIFRSMFASIHYRFTLWQKSSVYPKIHILKISLFTKFTISKPHFSQNSPFQNLIFHKIHILKISFFTKNHIFQTSNSRFLDKKFVFVPARPSSSRLI